MRSFRGPGACLLVLSLTACGKGADDGAKVNGNGPDGVLGPSCEGTLVVAGAEASIECSQGVSAIGGGLYELVLDSPPATQLTLRLPSLDSGSYRGADCLAGSAGFDGRPYTAAVSADSPALNLTRAGDHIAGDFEGNFCDSSQLPLRCITVSISSFSAGIVAATSDCNCASATGDPTCEIGICTAEGCATQQCPTQSALCAALP